MASRFNISQLALLASEGTDYSFTLTPLTALTENTMVRWDIILSSGGSTLAAASNQFSALSGTLSFASGTSTAETVTLPIVNNDFFNGDRAFTLRLTQIASDGTEEQLGDDTTITLSDEADEGDRYTARSRALTGGAEDDIITLGSNESWTPNGSTGDDAIIVSRFHYGEANINDALGQNLIKFDNGVTITHMLESGLRSTDFTFVSSVELTLSTGGTITITLPDQDSGSGKRYSFQLGDGEVMNYEDFYREITQDTDGDGTSDAFVSGTSTGALAEEHHYEVTSFIDEVPSIVESTRARALTGGAGNDIFTLGSNESWTPNGSTGDDAIIVTRFHYGAATINDALGQNLIKFDSGVTITHLLESGLRSDDFTFVSSVDLTLSTGGAITITLPDQDSGSGKRYSFQIGNGEVTNYESFYAEIISGGLADDTTGELQTPYEITLIEDVPNTAPFFTIPLSAHSVTNAGLPDGVDYGVFGVNENIEGGSAGVIVLTATATDNDGDQITYSLQSDSFDNNVFQIDSASGAIRFNENQADFEAKTDGIYTIEITASSTSPEGVESVITQRVQITLSDVNEAPVSIGAIAAETINIPRGDEASITFDFADNLFSDPDGDSLTYSASGQPSGVNFDPNARSFTVTNTAEGGVYTVEVTASDSDGLSATTSFTLTLQEDDGDGVFVVGSSATDSDGLTSEEVAELSPSDTLHAAESIADPDGSGSSLSYQWLRGQNSNDLNAIHGATESSYTLTTADIGMHLAVRVSYTDGEGFDESTTTASVQIPTPAFYAMPDTGDTYRRYNDDGFYQYQEAGDADDLSDDVLIGGSSQGVAIIGSSSNDLVLIDGEVGESISSLNAGSGDDVYQIDLNSFGDGISGPLHVRIADTFGNNVLHFIPDASDDVKINQVYTDNFELHMLITQSATSGGGREVLGMVTLSHSAFFRLYDEADEQSTGLGDTTMLADLPDALTDDGAVYSIASSSHGSIPEVSDLEIGDILYGNQIDDSVTITSPQYQWYRDGSAITDETGAQYTITDADKGANISLTVTHSGGQTTSTPSVHVALINSGGAELQMGDNTDNTIISGDSGALIFGGEGDDSIMLGDGADAVLYRLASSADALTALDGSDRAINFTLNSDAVAFVDTEDSLLSWADLIAHIKLTDDVEVSLTGSSGDYSGIVFAFNQGTSAQEDDSSLSIDFATNAVYTFGSNEIDTNGVLTETGLDALDDFFGADSAIAVGLDDVSFDVL